MSHLDPIPFGEIDERHLRMFAENGVGEGLDLEFKEASYGASDDARREFLKDVTAMANTAGGHIVIGIAAADGVATGLKPISTLAADPEKLRLENMLLSAVEPRLVGLQIGDVAVAGGYILVVRVPRSWNAPHRVTYKGLNRYYLRHSSGAFEPSVDQLRAVFVGGVEAERRLHEFRLDRLARLRTGGRGAMLRGRGQLVVQTVPLADAPSGFAIPRIQDAMNDFMPPGAHSLSWRYNFDGMLIHSVASDGAGRTTAYTQLFRDGRVEMARGGYVREGRAGNGGAPIVVAGALVADMVAGVRRCLLGARKHGAPFPIAVMVSFLDAQGTTLPVSAYDFDRLEPLDRPDLLFPPLIVEDSQDAADWERAMLPVLDALWNAYGYELCFPVRGKGGDWAGVPQNWR